MYERSISSASARSRSVPIPSTSIRAGCTRKRSTTCATASRARRGSSSLPGNRLGQDHAAADAAAQSRHADDGGPDRQHDAGTARAARDDHDRLRARSQRPQQAADAARSVAVSRRSAAGLAAAAAALDRSGGVAVADAPAPVPAPVAVSAVTRAESAELAARALAVEQREQSVRQREMAIAEQRRVLAEEYRLLRARSAQARPEPAPSARQVAPAARFEAAPDESFWRRVKRIMLGVSAS